MTAVIMDLTDTLLLKDDLEASLKAYKFSQDERISIEIDDEVAEWLCVALFATLAQGIQRVILAELPEQRSVSMLTPLATRHGFGLIRPASATQLPCEVSSGNTNDTTPIPPAARFLPCLTPVGPSKCLHPGSHHAPSGGSCTHPGCDCNAFNPKTEALQAPVSTETVTDYLRSIALLRKSPWDGDEVYAALHRAWIPAEAPASDWHAMLGRVFPDMADTIAMESPA